MVFTQYLIDRIFSLYFCNLKNIELNWAEEKFFEMNNYLNLKLIIDRLGNEFSDSYLEFNKNVVNRQVMYIDKIS